MITLNQTDKEEAKDFLAEVDKGLDKNEAFALKYYLMGMHTAKELAAAEGPKKESYALH